jgi:catechol 2,3-dioxygenase-like lactoylglutathione lyase family enzyme
MWDHVTLRVADLRASARFYDLVLSTLGIERTNTEDWIVEWGEFSISPADADKPPTRGLHIGFAAPTRDHVDAFWESAVEKGYPDDGAPGPRPQYTRDYYGGFVLDPDGNSVEAVHHGDLEGPGIIDHLWIRVADVEAAKAFYLAVAPHTGAELRNEVPGRAHFGNSRGSFSVLENGHVTENLHMAFAAADRDGVHAFHSAATGAGYRDNGGPGVRPEYHPGYYGAFALDPDGNNVEAVFHDR